MFILTDYILFNYLVVIMSYFSNVEHKHLMSNISAKGNQQAALDGTISHSGHKFRHSSL